MAIVPILLDRRPAYLGGGSLLLLPLGAEPLIQELAAAVAQVTPEAPFVLAGADVDERYEEGLRSALPRVRGVLGEDVLLDPLARFEPSDQLLLVGPDWYPADRLELRELVGSGLPDSRMVRHLVAFEASALRTKELVDADVGGRVRRIRRYYDPVTWPFPVGVVATLVPVPCLADALRAVPGTLDAVRRALALHGVASQDVPYHGALCDLADEAGALALAERRLHAQLRAAERARRGAPTGGEEIVVAAGAVVHETARLIGPVYVASGAIVEGQALVVGPAVIGPGARVGQGATVAQCLVAAGATATARATFRHRVVAPVARTSLQPLPGAQRRHVGASVPSAVAAPSFGEGAPRWYPPLKTAVDRLVALTLLVALSPLLLVVGLLVALTSPGPVLYGQLREGRDGRFFRCFKFRSMRPDAESLQRTLEHRQELDGPQFKMSDDPRVTRVGRWLRRTNLDELPQLLNVLRGEMSLVGPRPSPFRENQICVPWRHARLTVRPGITGLWQICRHDRAGGDFHQWIHYDLLYVRHASPRVDARILFYTLRTLGGRHPVPVEVILRTPSAEPAAARPGFVTPARAESSETAMAYSAPATTLPAHAPSRALS